DLLGGIFRAAYEGDSATLASSIGLRMKPYLDQIEVSFNQNPGKTSASLRRHWPIKSSPGTFEDIRSDIISFIAGHVRKVADASKERISVDRNRLKGYLGGRVSLGGTQVY